MRDISELEKKLGMNIKDKELFNKAFIHRSYVNENIGIEDNERLEFLGDAVLELIVTNFLFHEYPEKPEGELTTLRSSVVKGKYLSKIARELELGQYLYLSKGEESSGGRDKEHILANVTEALIGAIYLDQGFEVAERFVREHMLKEIEEILELGLHIDAKTSFQELSQERENVTPEYRLIEESGPDHNKKFIMGVFLEEELIASGEGSSKQKAEQDAAHKALEQKNWI